MVRYRPQQPVPFSDYADCAVREFAPSESSVVQSPVGECMSIPSRPSLALCVPGVFCPPVGLRVAPRQPHRRGGPWTAGEGDDSTEDERAGAGRPRDPLGWLEAFEDRSLSSPEDTVQRHSSESAGSGTVAPIDQRLRVCHRRCCSQNQLLHSSLPPCPPLSFVAA
jgi:hypothetical protein